MTDKNESTALVLGIDTGGTYTDGVLLEYQSRRVAATHKSLTTKRDFAIGIENVIAEIDIPEPTAVKMVSISTTLATNAIAEGGTGRGRRVALLLIGYDPDLIAKFKLARRFGTPRYAFIGGGHDLYGREKEPLDEAALRNEIAALQGEVDAIAISAYFSPLNPTHENQALAVVREMCQLPVVLGHQLSTKLGSVERATTAALNASLLAVLQEFVVAVRRALARRQIDAPLMVVRGDGTLMSADFAAAAPVETIHSGPAASAIGGRFLSRLDDALVIDVGGTTTDIALVEGGEVAVNEEGARVDGYKTAVQAANLLSIPLGGDSHIHQTKEQKLAVGPERVTPLAYLAHRYPSVLPQLQNLSHRIRTLNTTDWLEYWFLLRDPGSEAGQTAGERELLELLRQGPQPLPRILEQLKLFHPGQIDAGELWRREILGKAGLTPTDLLHVDGRYTPWCVEASQLAVDVFYRFLFPAAADLHRAVWRQMTEMVSSAVLTFLSERTVPPPGRTNDADLGRWFFDNSLYDIHPHLESRLRLRLPVIGIGAAAEVTLAGMAEALQTELVLPPHHQVANAVGAVAGSVMVAEEVLVYPRLSQEGLDVYGYYVQGPNGRTQFGDIKSALAHARQLGREHALDAARRAGADNPQVTIREIASGLDTYRVRAEAVGNPRLAK